MSELDKAYEAAEMLKALDLPISKAQLDDIERLEIENGKIHREDLDSYFFEKCFTNYTKRITTVQRNFTIRSADHHRSHSEDVWG